MRENRAGCAGRRILAAALLSVSGAVVALAEAASDPRGRAPSPATVERSGSRIPYVPIYRATGVRDGTTAATAVHCTNLDLSALTVFVDFHEFDGTFECGLDFVIDGNRTATLATRATALYFEDAACDPSPGSNQGYVEVWVPSSTSKVMCTAQVVDPASATPAYVTTLDRFRP
jgi:hypothetical protein